MERTPKLYMHTADAAMLGIADGDGVRGWNARGEVELTAVVGDDVLPGVVVSQGRCADSPGGKRRSTL